LKYGNGVDISNLWTAWPVAGPWHLSPLAGGTHNLVWHAEAADGQSYVLRLSFDMNRIPRIRYESALLRSTSGDIIVLFEQETGAPAFATLYPLVPGSPPERNDPINASKAGSALALLDGVLATLPEIHPADGFQSLPTFGALFGRPGN
jgi:Phosphotransferase enzyme family